VGFGAAVFAGVLGFFGPLVEGVFAPVNAVRMPCASGACEACDAGVFCAAVFAVEIGHILGCRM